jgi:hypothetical protein
MKLIRANTLEVVEFFDSDVPPYAILSHTWVQNEEVSYQEMVINEGKQKSGFHKIRQCCSQALEDGLEWAWIDTCSIDKTSSAELSEAINSMFRYYSQAVVCYAYLADVKWADAIPSSGSQATALANSFKKSRWFTRGWTLQELLAPSKVIFYSASWNLIGDREEWRHEISDITSIHYSALTQGTRDFTKFSIAQRMSWAASRETTREEDVAYCLLGIFGVHMPLLYGEGSNAFIRLQEEIMRNSDDQSIFAWQNPVAISFTHHLSLLSPSPKYFQNSSMRAVHVWEQSQPYSMTNSGLQLTAILIQNPSRWGGVHVLCLPVYDESEPDLVVALPLTPLSTLGDQFARASGSLIFIPTLELQQAGRVSSRQIYVRKEIDPLAIREAEKGRRAALRVLIHQNHKIQVRIEDYYPRRRFELRSSGAVVFVAAENIGIASYIDGWSWHAAAILSLQVAWADETTKATVSLGGEELTPSLSFSETCQCVLLIGYNGRTNRPWCAFNEIPKVAGRSPAQTAWTQPLREIGNTTAKWIFWRKKGEKGEDSDGQVGSPRVEMFATIGATVGNREHQELDFEIRDRKDSRLHVINIQTQMLI